jgi:hypothetical protein
LNVETEGKVRTRIIDIGSITRIAIIYLILFYKSVVTSGLIARFSFAFTKGREAQIHNDMYSSVAHETNVYRRSVKNVPFRALPNLPFTAGARKHPPTPS